MIVFNAQQIRKFAALLRGEDELAIGWLGRCKRGHWHVKWLNDYSPDDPSAYCPTTVAFDIRPLRECQARLRLITDQAAIGAFRLGGAEAAEEVWRGRRRWWQFWKPKED